MTERVATQQGRTVRSWLAALYRFARGSLALVGLYVLVFTLCFDLGPIVSPSMQPTLRGSKWGDGDWVLSEKISYWFRSPRRWEVIRIRADDGVIIMKRVAGLPGETVQLLDFGVMIDGHPQPAPPALDFLRYYAYGPHSRGGKATNCGDGYFVLGDDSKDSQDSRYDGPIDPAKVCGRAWLRVWPMERIGWVTP